METDLPAILSPADLKALPDEQLPALAEKIRKTLIETLAERISAVCVICTPWSATWREMNPDIALYT